MKVPVFHCNCKNEEKKKKKRRRTLVLSAFEWRQRVVGTCSLVGFKTFFLFFINYLIPLVPVWQLVTHVLISKDKGAE